MTEQEVTDALVDRSVLGLTMWAEGRGDSREGHSSVEERIAIGCVIRNRIATFQRWRATAATYRAICLAPKQFSCWNEGTDANHAALIQRAWQIVSGEPTHDAVLDECLFLADGIISGVILDRTGGATSYFSPKAMTPPGRVPTWAQGRESIQIGDQLFFSERTLTA
jgi:hypothetical protein